MVLYLIDVGRFFFVDVEVIFLRSIVIIRVGYGGLYIYCFGRLYECRGRCFEILGKRKSIVIGCRWFVLEDRIFLCNVNDFISMINGLLFFGFLLSWVVVNLGEFGERYISLVVFCKDSIKVGCEDSGV